MATKKKAAPAKAAGRKKNSDLGAGSGDNRGGSDLGGGGQDKSKAAVQSKKKK